jgi:hypothetical protein
VSPAARRSRSRLVAAAVVVVAASMPLSACKEVEEETAEGYVPAKIEPIKGSDLQRVTFTAEGARRVGLQTAPVRRSGTREAVPYAALIYDAEGKTYVYRTTGRLTFVREPVDVVRVAGGTAVLSRGPAPGTRVVTVGAAEVYGTELEVGH